MRRSTVWWPLALLALLAGAASADGGALQRISEKGVLEVAVYGDFPPFSYTEDGKTRGIDVDIGHALAERLGVSASIRLVTPDENVEDDLRNNVWKGHYLGGGVADVMLHVPYDREFGVMNDRVTLIAPYYREQIVVGLDARFGAHESALDVFTREKVGVELDTLADFYLLSVSNGAVRPNVVHYRNVGEATAALLRGEVAGVMAPRSEVEAGLGDRAGQYRLGPIQTPGLRQSGWDLGAAVKAGQEDLAETIDRAMAALRSEGVIQRIFASYGVTYQQPSQVRIAGH